jgi:hypothetical protein
MTPTLYQLQQRRQLLGEQIAGNLDILMGSISTQGGNRAGFNLTFKRQGITRSRYIRKQDLQKVRLMTGRYQKLKLLLHELAELNWRILSLESEQ